MTDQSIEVKYAKFHAAVNNAEGIPENYFSEASNVQSRNVKMWMHRELLICLHKDQYILVPQSNVIFSEAK